MRWNQRMQQDFSFRVWFPIRPTVEKIAGRSRPSDGFFATRQVRKGGFKFKQCS